MYANYGKRTLDIVGATLMLVVTFPIALVIALTIRYTSEGPVLFRQERTGLHGKVFRMYKFRSMAHHNNVHDRESADYVTPVGKVLRMTSLDELPQLINVIRGDMSFIGPRPWLHAYYEHMNTKQRKRNSVRPGITGLAQAHGRNNLNIFEKIAYDLEYVHDISLREDIKVIFVTIKTLFDHEAHELGKGGIHDELDELKGQQIAEG